MAKIIDPGYFVMSGTRITRVRRQNSQIKGIYITEINSDLPPWRIWHGVIDYYTSYRVAVLK